MKEGIFSFIWAGICALLSVWLVLYVDAKSVFLTTTFFQQLWMQSMILDGQLEKFCFSVYTWFTGLLEYTNYSKWHFGTYRMDSPFGNCRRNYCCRLLVCIMASNLYLRERVVFKS